LSYIHSRAADSRFCRTKLVSGAGTAPAWPHHKTGARSRPSHADPECLHGNQGPGPLRAFLWRHGTGSEVMPRIAAPLIGDMAPRRYYRWSWIQRFMRWWWDLASHPICRTGTSNRRMKRRRLS